MMVCFLRSLACSPLVQSCLTEERGEGVDRRPQHGGDPRPPHRHLQQEGGEPGQHLTGRTWCLAASLQLVQESQMLLSEQLTKFTEGVIQLYLQGLD